MATQPRAKSKFPSPTKKLHKVLICGDRNYTRVYVKAVRKVIHALTKIHGTKNLLIIEGGAPGVDSIVKVIAHKSNVHVAEIEALWDTRHKSAGGQRNEMMAALWPDEVIGIHSDLASSRGTKGMLDLAKRLGIPNTLIEPEAE